MGNIIEQESNGNEPTIHVGDGSSQISIKAYQDLYHQITGRTEQERKRYPKNVLIEYSEIEQLHHKIMQLCDVHHIVAKNEVVSIFHEKERKQVFTSFERFKNYNSNATSPTINVVLRYNFSIIPAGLNNPQEYVISIRLISRLAKMNEIKSELPPFIRGSVVGYIAKNTIEVTVDYADYIIARGFLEAIDEWVNGCKSEPDNLWLKLSQQFSFIIPKGLRLATAIFIIILALNAIPIIFINQVVNLQIWTRFLIIFSGGFYILINISESIGRVIENAIDSYTEISYLKLNKGDRNIIDNFNKKRKWVLLKLILSVLSTIVLGIISTKLSDMI